MVTLAVSVGPHCTLAPLTEGACAVITEAGTVQIPTNCAGTAGRSVRSDRADTSAARVRDRFTVEPGSALAGDDRATAPHQLSHVAVAAMGHSVEHLQAIRALIVVARWSRSYRHVRPSSGRSNVVVFR